MLRVFKSCLCFLKRASLSRSLSHLRLDRGSNGLFMFSGSTVVLISMALCVLATKRRKILLKSARTTLLKMSERFSVKWHARKEPGSGAGKQTLKTIDPFTGGKINSVRQARVIRMTQSAVACSWCIQMMKKINKLTTSVVTWCQELN